MEAVLLVAEFHGAFVPAVLGAVLLVLLGVVCCRLIRVRLDFVLDLVCGAVGLQGGIAFGASAVQGDLTEVDQPRRETHLDDVDERLGERLAVILAGVADGAEVWLLVGGDEPKSNVASEQAVELARAADPNKVVEAKNLNQQHRMVVYPFPAVVAFLGIERFESTLRVDEIDNVRDEHFEAIVLNPIGDRFRQEMLLVLIVSDEAIRHYWHIMLSSYPFLIIF